MDQEELERLETFFTQHESFLKERISAYVELESPSEDNERLGALACLQEKDLEGLGAKIRSGVGNSRLVTAEFGTGSPKLALVFHHDTVWPLGSYLNSRVEEGRWFAPGIYDMKANIPLVQLSLAYLREFEPTSLNRILWLSSPDEETLGPVSTFQLPEAGKSCQSALVFEPPLKDGGLKQRRKGSVRLELLFEGLPSHTGNHYQKGKSALAAAARFLLFAEGLNDFAKGLTINVGILNGGTAANTRPAEAVMQIDVRMTDLEDWLVLKERFQGYEDEKDVKINIKQLALLPPMNTSHSEWALLGDICRKLECPFSLGGAGGGSDGSRLASLGVRVMDGLGILGGNEHAADEFIELSWLGRYFMRNTLLIKRLLA